MLCYFNNDNWGILHTGTIHFGYCENCLKILKKITWNVLNVELLLKQLWKSINLYSVNHFAFWIFQKKLPMKKFVKNMWNIYILSASIQHQYQCFEPRFVPTLQTFALSRNPHSRDDHVFVSFEFKREKPHFLFFNTEHVWFFLEKNSIYFHFWIQATYTRICRTSNYSLRSKFPVST